MTSSSIQPARLKRLFTQMLDIYSPSGKEEEILEYLYGYLRRHRLPVQKHEVDEHRYNLVVLPERPPLVTLVGHLDTVSAFDLDDYRALHEGDQISGLGSADMKGGCAAMIEAFLALDASGGGGPPVALALVVGEEEEGDGAEALARDFDFPWAVIGEPTELRPCLSSYGYIEVQLTTTGKRMHASLGQNALNPIQTMLHLILRITHHIEASRPDLVYNIRDLHSAQAGFVVPDFCEAWLDLHMPPSASTGEIVTGLEEMLYLENKENASFAGAIRFATIDAGYELPAKGPVVEALRNIYVERGLRWEPTPFRSHSDANRLFQYGIRPLLLGPGRLDVAHTSDEAISFDEVVHAAEIYRDLLIAIGARNSVVPEPPDRLPE